MVTICFKFYAIRFFYFLRYSLIPVLKFFEFVKFCRSLLVPTLLPLFSVTAASEFPVIAVKLDIMILKNIKKHLAFVPFATVCIMQLLYQLLAKYFGQMMDVLCQRR